MKYRLKMIVDTTGRTMLTDEYLSVFVSKFDHRNNASYTTDINDAFSWMTFANKGHVGTKAQFEVVEDNEI